MSQLQARPTYYKGTLMRSRLEAGFAQRLDDMKAKWTYEGHAYAGSLGQWLPDFVLVGDVGPLLVEIKPVGTGTVGLSDLWKRMHVARESDPTAELALVVGSWRNDGYDYSTLWRCSKGTCWVCKPPERAALGARARRRMS